MSTYGIITHYDVHNHGAVLQLNALVEVLRREFGIEASALQFDKNYDFLGHGLKAKYELSFHSVGIYWDYLRQHGSRRVLFNMRKKRLLDGFKRAHRLVGPYYTECGELDGVVVGSDEVFALHTGPTPVFFGHACPSDHVFSYGGCFGPTTLSDIDRLHCRSFVSSGLCSMSGLGMRDQNSLSIARTLTGRDAVLVCDPVLLYGYEREIASLPAPSLPPYLLVYAYDNRMNAPEEVSRILAYARERKLKVVSPGFYHRWADVNVNVDPVGLLGYFRGASCVVTDTFHGCVMSLITQREVAVKLRDNANKLLNLLEEYGQQSRVLGEGWNLDEVFSRPMDYGFIRSEISRRRAESMAYLRAQVAVGREKNVKSNLSL